MYWALEGAAAAGESGEKRKVFFNRGTFDEAKSSKTTAMMEVESWDDLSVFDKGKVIQTENQKTALYMIS